MMGQLIELAEIVELAELTELAAPMEQDLWAELEDSPADPAEHPHTFPIPTPQPSFFPQRG